MYSTDTPNEVLQIVTIAAELGAIAAIIATGQIRPYLKKSEAFKRFGRKNIENWIDLGLITPRKDGDYSAAWRIDRLEVEAIKKAILILEILNQP